MKKKTTFPRRLIAVVSSRYFFVGILALMVLQALWIALSGRYPMAFDEDFHLGIIRLYAHHISPFWGAQPPNADSFGAVVRDPSYLYHYLMSFPYRLLSVFTDNQTTQVIGLRLLNIGLFTGGLVIWRKLLLKSGASRAIVHSCLLAFVLLPVVPLLAAQINYDNLFIPAVGLVLLLTANLGESLRKYRMLSTKLVLQILILCQVISLVKYAFLPIFVAIAAYVVIEIARSPDNWKKVLFSLGFGWTLMTRSVRRTLVAVLIIVSCLFVQRYGVNVVRYHQPVPECDKVLSIQQCSAYGPWLRNYTITHHKDLQASHSPLTFSADWFYGMWLRTFFAVDGPSTSFETRGPLILPGIGAIVFAAAALVAVVLKVQSLWRAYNQSVLTLFLIVAASYIAVLWIDGYKAFVQLGETVAINGRYLFPVALALLLVGALGVNELLKNRRDRKVIFAGLAIFCLVWGGGTMTYILRSRDGWYWSNSAVRRVNYDVRQTVGPVVPGYRHPIEFMSRN